MEDSVLDDFLKRNREMADHSLERLRGLSESDKHWTARRSFLVRNLSDYPRDRLDYLVALSMVWSNHVFMGCRYSNQLMEKVLDMADGVHVEDAPHFTTRDEIMQQAVPYWQLVNLSSENIGEKLSVIDGTMSTMERK